MCYREARLVEGDEVSEGAERYKVQRVDQAPRPSALRHAWATLIEATS
jgi:hypothetical protein